MEKGKKEAEKAMEKMAKAIVSGDSDGMSRSQYFVMKSSEFLMRDGYSILFVDLQQPLVVLKKDSKLYEPMYYGMLAGGIVFTYPISEIKAEDLPGLKIRICKEILSL
ncbi:MAG: hypothetical protein WC608_03875 [Parcubacteria group bacterium]